MQRNIICGTEGVSCNVELDHGMAVQLTDIIYIIAAALISYSTYHAVFRCLNRRQRCHIVFKRNLEVSHQDLTMKRFVSLASPRCLFTGRCYSLTYTTLHCPLTYALTIQNPLDSLAPSIIPQV
jgi:hypothetical protein